MFVSSDKSDEDFSGEAVILLIENHVSSFSIYVCICSVAMDGFWVVTVKSSA